MRRKVLAMSMVLAVLISGMTAVASNPSATGSDVTIVPDTYEGEEVSGYVVDADGNIIQGVALDSEDQWIEVTDANNTESLSEESQEKMDSAVEQLSSIDSVTGVVDESTIPEDFDYENAEAIAVFDVDASDNIKEYLADNPGAKLSLNVEVGVEADVEVLTIHNYEDDQWEVLESSNNNDGSINITIGENGLSPVAVYIETSSENTDTDTDTEDEAVVTGDDNNVMGLVLIAVVALVGAGAMIIVRKRKEDAK